MRNGVSKKRHPGMSMMNPFSSPANPARVQGIPLVHLSAHRKCLLWDMRCIWWMCRGRLGGVKRYEGAFRVYFVSEMAYTRPLLSST